MPRYMALFFNLLPHLWKDPSSDMFRSAPIVWAVALPLLCLQVAAWQPDIVLRVNTTTVYSDCFPRDSVVINGTQNARWLDTCWPVLTSRNRSRPAVAPHRGPALLDQSLQ